jgi:hypothetical protein
MFARFVPQAILWTFFLACNKAGNKIPSTRHTHTGIIIPRMAKLVPVSLPPLFSIIMKLTIPKIIAGIAVRPHVKGAMIPSTNAAMAKPLIFGVSPSVLFEALGSSELHDLHT